MKKLSLLVVVLLVCVVASLIVAVVVSADGPKGEGSPLSQSDENCPVEMQGQGGEGPTQAQRNTEYTGPNGQGAMNTERRGPEALALACHFHLGEVYRPVSAVEQWVEQGHATWGECPDPVNPIIITPTLPVTTNTPVVMYRVFLPIVLTGYGQVPQPVVDNSERATLVRVTTITTRTITTTTITTTWSRVDTIYTVTTTTTQASDNGIPDWLLVLVAMATPILMVPVCKALRKYRNVNIHMALYNWRKGYYAMGLGWLLNPIIGDKGLMWFHTHTFEPTTLHEEEALAPYYADWGEEELLECVFNPYTDGCYMYCPSINGMCYEGELLKLLREITVDNVVS